MFYLPQFQTRSTALHAVRSLLLNINMDVERYRMHFRALLLTTLMLLSACHTPTDFEKLEGHYYLQDVQPMAMELQLRKDGTFNAQVALVGYRDNAEGLWDVEDQIVTLQTPRVTQTASAIAFNARFEDTQTDLEEIYPPQNKHSYELWNGLYVLEMRYARYQPIPDIKPRHVYFEFSQGPSSKLLLSSGKSTDLWLPYDPQRTLKKIGFSRGLDSAPTQWIEVLPTSRQFYIGWKKPHKQPLSFELTDEMGLREADELWEGNKEQIEREQQNYMIVVSYNEFAPKPTVKPVDVYWQFQDGSTQQQVWADSKQSKLTIPYTAAQTLKRVGMRMQGAPTDIQWFDVKPTARWLHFGWQELPDGPLGTLASELRNQQLTIEPDCLKLTMDNDHRCFRRK